MAFEKLDKAIDSLEDTILQFPIGAKTKDDYKPIEQKIMDIRESLIAINARCLTAKAIIDCKLSSNSSEKLHKSYDKLNKNISNYLINRKALILCNQSRGIQDIIFQNEGSKEIQEKVKVCLQKLFILNDKLISKHEKRKKLMKKQHHLKLESCNAIYDYQDFLKERETIRNQRLKELNPDYVQFKVKINRSISKIYTMKKLITNLIASMYKELYNNVELIEVLGKHKDMINYETIKEIARNTNLNNS
ncbi:PREDICTED: uncharacterized protein LOC105365534 [Ceratosolen solmsi marchali]|uniref:Uncharacterized protein LOC105365534 n=1 Tax=Ceratosolen solmsi marchali TaxID=326594 RepID=A0AAJ6YPX4_9HYME|nr:PREDICTED: uncharacterized protein LOC105365534 [Ceratosolen solmsi marchali]